MIDLVNILQEMDRRKIAFSATAAWVFVVVVVFSGPSIILLSGLGPNNKTTATIQLLSSNSSNDDNNNNGAPQSTQDSSTPQLSDSSLQGELVVKGLQQPTSMKFVDQNNILILEKETGEVRLVSNGKLQPDPVFQTTVESQSERGMLGVAVSNASAATANGTTTKNVFLYHTEQGNSSEDVRNRIYKYDWDGGSSKFGEGKLILDLPATPGPNHDAGKLVIGPDGMLYAVIGDQNRDGMDQNFENGPPPDDTSAIFRIDQNGNAAKDNPLSDNDPAINAVLSKYYAYGIRNSFGLDFDPVTGKLWDTENGPLSNDEINVVAPGFNSGWQDVQGPIERTGKTTDGLVQFKGSHYQDPVFTWATPPAVTDIEFFKSTKLGEKYANNIFVGDYNNGNLYFFTVNKERSGLVLDGNGLQDLVVDNPSEASKVTFGTGFKGGITDI
ncbi:MAG TPA: PQQ-dependent sugar dehydrogenase, partial [Nitrososphaera sp.]|nr:PQQ-dependent sugar dehydrogenase [Nitrososphaera sp.]